MAEIQFGWAAARPELAVRLVHVRLPWWKSAVYAAQAFVTDIVVPALLFAAAFVCFTYAFWTLHG